MAKSSGFASAIDTHDGLGGPFSRTVYIRQVDMPDEPTGGDLTVSPNVPPTGWNFEPPVGTIQLWKSVVRFVPGGDAFETTSITYSGTTGLQTGTAAVFEDGFFDVSGTPGTDITAVAEISTVTTTGVSGLQVGVAAIAEDGFFDVNGTPGTDIAAVAEISTVTTTGVSGLRVENPAVAEDGFFDVTGTPGTDIPAVAEISTVTTTGTSGVVTQIPATTEIQTLFQGGTRSNVASAGSNTTVTVELGGEFQSGINQPTNNTIVFSGFPQETHLAAHTKSWGEGTPTTIPQGWSYLPAVKGVGTDFAPARLTLSAGGSLNFTSATFAMDVTIGTVTGGATFNFGVSIRSTDLPGEFLSDSGGSSVTAGSNFTVSATFFSSGNLQKNDYIELFIETPTGTDPRPYTYTINSITLSPTNTVTGDASGYSLELGTLPLLPGGSSTLTGLFGNGLGPNTALASLIDPIEANWSGVSATVVDITPFTVIGTETSTTTGGFDNRSKISVGKWAIARYIRAEEVDTIPHNGDWDDWVPTSAADTIWFGQDPTTALDAYENLVIDAVSRFGIINSTITLTDKADSNNFVSFVISAVRESSSQNYWFAIESFALDAMGSPIRGGGPANSKANAQATNYDISFTLGEGDSSLVIDTGQTGAISPLDWTITQNDGQAGTDDIGTTAGSAGGSPSTYTVRDDGGAIVGASFTSSVANPSLSDAAAVNTAIENLIDTNTQSPINFFASVNASDNVLVTAASTGAVSGLWSVTVSNGGGNGNLTYGNGTLTNGVADETQTGTNASTTGTLDTWTVTIDGTVYTDTFLTGSNANSQATQIAAFLNADT